MLLPLSASPTLQSRWNELVQVSAPSDSRSLVYRHGPTLPKPGFHPLTTPRGHVLTGWEMSDHVWHRGLWFAVKFLNGENFWEELVPFGIQTTASGPHAEPISDDAVRMTHDLHWRSAGGDAVLNETRRVTMRLSSDGVTTLDWETALRANGPVTLDRTPFTTWGGYGGLSLRASREMHQVDFLLPDGRTVPSITGESHPWVVMQGRLDGGKNERVSICFIDHPQNPGHPVPWYGKSGNGFSFINAAFLFHAPLMLAAGENLRFRYRVLYRDGIWPADAISALAKNFYHTAITS